MKNRMMASVSILGAIMVMAGNNFGHSNENEIGSNTIDSSSPDELANESSNSVQDKKQDKKQDNENAKTTKTDRKKGYFERASDALKRAKSSGNSQAEAAEKWLNKQISGATESTTDAVQDSGDWANETYKMLKGQGLTTANSVGEWLSDDIRNMDSWEYKVVRLSLSSPDLEKRLNGLGAKGWELASVSVHETPAHQPQHTLVFKKSRRSYLRSVPLKDLLPLIPLMGAGDTPK